jgi:hypothetical protein
MHFDESFGTRIEFYVEDAHFLQQVAIRNCIQIIEIRLLVEKGPI